MRGTTVCDIGLQVPSASATVERARQLGAEPSSPRPLHRVNWTIPAIRGLGGSVLHFIDEESGLGRVWDVEFEDSARRRRAGVGLTRVDHLAQTMSYDEMLSWSLFYHALFDMQKAPMVDVIDPDGLVRSQAIADPRRRFRITLNGAETHRTLAGKFLAETFGASVQHIALACGRYLCDRESAGRRPGFKPLAISPNYYADLAARFDLDPRILRPAQGRSTSSTTARTAVSFFQIYSRAFTGGTFFEILERRGGYDGYGAPNAPFRIAAQKRNLRPKGMPAR